MGSSDARVADVVIVGGGPAGCAAARLLASWGHSVVLVTKIPPRSLAESIPPSCDKLFRALDLTEIIDAAGFLRATGNTVWWGGDESRSESFAGGRCGWQVLRADLDRALLEGAERAGAAVLRGVTVREADLPPDPSLPRTLRLQAPRFPVSGRILLDCSGRAGLVARKGLRRYERQSTMALVGVWRRAGGYEVPDDSHTLVEAYAGGWAWSVPVRAGTRHVAMMVDPRVSGLERGTDAGGVYAGELGKTRALRRLLADAELTGRPWACDASIYNASTVAGPGWLLVGDAASFIDPLSSYGIKKALASAWLAAIVAHTGLHTPEMWGPATELYARREREMFTAAMRQTRQFFAEAGARHAHAFWQARSEDRPEPLAEEDGDLDALRRDPAVASALEALRRAPVLHLVPAGDVRVESAPAVGGRLIVLDRRLVCPAFPSGIRFLRGVDLPKLFDLAPAHRQVPDLFETYNRRFPPVLLADFVGALAVMVGKGILKMTNDG